jgi:DNA-binding NarL/FixJ family response regulator
MAVLLDRDAELAELGERLARVRGGAGRVIVVEGPAGIGKSALLAACARDEGTIVLRARCSPLEQQAAWGTARQLFEPLRGRGDWAELTAGAAALAERALAPGLAEPAPGGDAMHSAARGLVWLVSNLAERGAAAIVVDDVHWSDAPSLRWLVLLAHSLEELPVGVLCAVRSGEPSPDLLAELLAFAPEPPVRPRPLGPFATETLVRARFAAASPAFAHACHSATGGNPFLTGALLAQLVADGVAPDDATAARLGAFGPEQVGRYVDRQLARLPDGAAALARAVVVLGSGAPLRHAGALAGLDVERASAAADALRAAGLLGDDDRGVALVHPLIASALYRRLPRGERSLCHAAAAHLLAGEDADPERVALHLLRTEPNRRAATVATLREAAARAADRGAPQSAAAYLRRALDEPPPDATEAAEVRLELGLALAAYLQPDAYELFQEAVAQATSPAQRSTIALRGARALGLIGLFDRAAALCRQGLDTGTRPELRERLEAELVTNAFTHVDTIAEACRSVPPAAPVLDLWRITTAMAQTHDGRPAADTLALLRPALENDALAAEPDSLLGTIATLQLIVNDELDRAIELCDALVELARPRGWLIALAHGCMMRAMALVRAGRPREAEPDARLAFEYKLPVAPLPAMLWCLSFLVDARVELDDLDGAQAALADAGQLDAPPPEALATPLFLQSRARLRLAQHRPEEALADALAAGRRAQRFGLRHPVLACWRAEAVEALVAVGDATRAAGLAAEHTELAERLGTPAARGAALRVTARCAAEPIPLLERAVTALSGSPARLEHTRALVDLGAALRRANRRADAREPLLHALEQADRGGMHRLARRARDELGAAGVRPRRSARSGPEALTPAEHRVATLAAEGYSNRAIAERLYITKRTVETHLTHSFQKLDVATRAELPAILGIAAPITRSR